PELSPLSLHDALPILAVSYDAGIATCLASPALVAWSGTVSVKEESCPCTSIVASTAAASLRSWWRTQWPMVSLAPPAEAFTPRRSEEHTSELQSRENL